MEWNRLRLSDLPRFRPGLAHRNRRGRSRESILLPTAMHSSSANCPGLARRRTTDTVRKITLADSTALGGSVLPQGIAVDSAQNVFFLAATSGTTAELMKIPFVSGSYSPSFVTIDSTLYYPIRDRHRYQRQSSMWQDTSPGRTSTPVYEYLRSGGTYAPRTRLFTTPHGGGAPMTLDGAGNLYLDWNSGDGGGAIYKQNRNVLPSDDFPDGNGAGHGGYDRRSLVLRRCSTTAMRT